MCVLVGGGSEECVLCFAPSLLTFSFKVEFYPWTWGSCFLRLETSQPRQPSCLHGPWYNCSCQAAQETSSPALVVALSSHPTQTPSFLEEVHEYNFLNRCFFLFTSKISYSCRKPYMWIFTYIICFTSLSLLCLCFMLS